MRWYARCDCDQSEMADCQVDCDAKAKYRATGRAYLTKDSGVREEFSTGSVRDSRAGKGRYDLLAVPALRRLAGVYERGAAKYGDHNWTKGQPVSRYLDSALRHTLQYLDGQQDEDHLAQAAWNLFAAMWTEERRPDLCDLLWQAAARTREEVGDGG